MVSHIFEKYGIQALRRKERLNKVFAPSALLWGGLPIFICLFLSVFLSIFIRRLSVPEVDINEDPITIVLFISFFVITCSLSGFLSMGYYLRLFTRRKGKTKAMKYVCELKKPPGLLGKIWLRLGGINQSDVKDYLDTLEESAQVDNRDKIGLK